MSWIYYFDYNLLIFISNMRVMRENFLIYRQQLSMVRSISREESDHQSVLLHQQASVCEYINLRMSSDIVCEHRFSKFSPDLLTALKVYKSSWMGKYRQYALHMFYTHIYYDFIFICVLFIKFICMFYLTAFVNWFYIRNKYIFLLNNLSN